MKGGQRLRTFRPS